VGITEKPAAVTMLRLAASSSSEIRLQTYRPEVSTNWNVLTEPTSGLNNKKSYSTSRPPRTPCNALELKKPQPYTVLSVSLMPSMPLNPIDARLFVLQHLENPNVEEQKPNRSKEPQPHLPTNTRPLSHKQHPIHRAL